MLYPGGKILSLSTRGLDHQVLGIWGKRGPTFERFNMSTCQLWECMVSIVTCIVYEYGNVLRCV